MTSPAEKPKRPPRAGTAASMASALAAAPQTAPVAPPPGVDAPAETVAASAPAETAPVNAPQKTEEAPGGTGEGGNPGTAIERREAPVQPVASAAALVIAPENGLALAPAQPRVPGFSRMVAKATPNGLDPAVHAMLTRAMEVPAMQLAATLRQMFARNTEFDQAVGLARSQGYPEAEIEALCLKHALDTPPPPGNPPA